MAEKNKELKARVIAPCPEWGAPDGVYGKLCKWIGNMAGEALGLQDHPLRGYKGSKLLSISVKEIEDGYTMDRPNDSSCYEVSVTEIPTERHAAAPNPGGAPSGAPRKLTWKERWRAFLKGEI